MTTDLHTRLTEIDGIGDVTASKIEDALAEHGTGAADETVTDLLETALDYADAGQHEYGTKYVRQALAELEG